MLDGTWKFDVFRRIELICDCVVCRILMFEMYGGTCITKEIIC